VHLESSISSLNLSTPFGRTSLLSSPSVTTSFWRAGPTDSRGKAPEGQGGRERDLTNPQTLEKEVGVLGVDPGELENVLTCSTDYARDEIS
jgi:hypothetical protein